MIQRLKVILLELFTLIIRPFKGSGIGRNKVIKSVFIYLVLAFTGNKIEINGFNMLICHKYGNKVTDEISLAFFLHRKWEPYTSALYKNEVKRSLTVVDVGANTGYFTLLAASNLPIMGKVYAFEPDIDNYRSLLKNIELNDYHNIVTFQQAVSNINGKSLLYLSKYGGWHSLRNSHGDSINSVWVDTVCLDHIFDGKHTPVDLVKIDVEGAEILVLKGMRQLVEKNDNIKIFIEFNPDCLEKSGFTARQFWDQLMDLGFKHIYIINENDNNLEQVDYLTALHRYTAKYRSAGSVNLLCLKILVETTNNI